MFLSRRRRRKREAEEFEAWVARICPCPEHAAQRESESRAAADLLEFIDVARDNARQMIEEHDRFVDEAARRFRNEWTDEDAADDGPVPPPEEVAAVMNAGVCDNPDLVGMLVLYETDRRGGKAYSLPAIVTCVQKSHVDLPNLRAQQEAFDGPGVILKGSGRPQFNYGSDMPVQNEDGYWLERNPVPIPKDGTVHLTVFTPDEQMIYRELSVPYDAAGKQPRSWRHHPETVPF